MPRRASAGSLHLRRLLRLGRDVGLLSRREWVRSVTEVPFVSERSSFSVVLLGPPAGEAEREAATARLNRLNATAAIRMRAVG